MSKGCRNDLKRFPLVEMLYAPGSMEAANKLLCEAIGAYPLLRDSPLGKQPHCLEKLGVSRKQHARMRKFADEAGLEQYEEYMQGLAEKYQRQCEQEPQLIFGNKYRGDGFYARVIERGGAEIEVRFYRPEGAKWHVQVIAWCDMDTARTAYYLESRGFDLRRLGCVTGWKLSDVYRGNFPTD